MENYQAYLPNVLVGNNQYSQQVLEVCNYVKNKRAEDIVQKKELINQVAMKYDRQYYQELFSGSPENIRILFYTSRFTQVVQYATRDFMEACKKMGIKCEVVIEKIDIHNASEMELINRIADFRPNIIFRVNYFKSDFLEIPSNILFITWMQDPGHQLDSTVHAEKFTWNDFALICSQNWLEKMSEIGYDRSRMIEQRVPINEDFFYIRDMPQDERDFYTADIAFPGNYQESENELQELIVKYTSILADDVQKNIMTKVLTNTYENFCLRINNGELIFEVEQCEAVINEVATLLKVAIQSQLVEAIGKDFFQQIVYNLHRNITLKWLIDYGFQVKLWGRGWEKNPDFKDHAMGLLAHGDELAKMYSCTKIVPGTFFWFTAHARSWESTSCGALCISRYVPPEFDLVNIREYFIEDEDFVFYRNKEELIDKVNYYLANEEERKCIVESGRQKILKTMTYSSAVSKCLELIKDNIVK